MGSSAVSETAALAGSISVPLFEALVCEVHHCAAMSAVVASCVNGEARDQLEISRQLMEPFVPQEPAMLLALTRKSMLEIELMPETQHVIDAFFVALEALRQKLARRFADDAELGTPRAQALHHRTLRLAAGRACHEGLRVVRALEVETPGRLSALYCAHAMALSRLLIAAERGETPCLDASGSPYLPDLPQRRRSSRRALGQRCRVISSGASAPAFVIDVSEGGLGLARVPFLAPGDDVVVEIESGRRFSGTVAWARSDRAGLKFHVPLDVRDPLLVI